MGRRRLQSSPLKEAEVDEAGGGSPAKLPSVVEDADSEPRH